MCELVKVVKIPTFSDVVAMLTSSNGLRVGIMTILVFAGALFSCLSYIYARMWSMEIAVFLGITSMFINIATQLPPMATSVQLIIFQCLGVLFQHFDSFCREIRKLSVDRRKMIKPCFSLKHGHGKKWCSLPAVTVSLQQENNEQWATKLNLCHSDQIEEMAATGLQLITAVTKAESALGLTIFWETGTCLLSLILGIFFSVGLVDSIVKANFQSVTFFHGLYETTVAILALTRLFVVFSSGERLTYQMHQAANELEELMMASTEDLPDHLKTKLLILCKRLSSPAAIRPLNSFDLSWSTALSTCGLLITCIVILLQFKFTEMQAPNCTHNSSTLFNK